VAQKGSIPVEWPYHRGRPFKYKELEIVKPINIKIMMALIEKEPGDQYVPVLKPVLMQILTEIKHLRRKNSQLGGKNARLRREKKALEIMLSAVVINDDVE
jgi:hypothetical protein